MRDIKEFLNKIHQGNSLEVLENIPDNSINTCITSPPYWGLRNYKTEPLIWGGDVSCKHVWGGEMMSRQRGNSSGSSATVGNQKKSINEVFIDHGRFCVYCKAWLGSLGNEPNPDLFIDNLCDIFDGVCRVLRDDGTCWVNIGDTYGGSWGKLQGYRGGVNETPVRTQSLVGIPFLFALGMIKKGFLLRNTIIWRKPNCIPSPVSNRYTVDFEYLFFFSKNKNYFFKQQFDPYTKPLDRWGGDNLNAKGVSLWDEGTGQKIYHDRNMRPNPKGKNKRSVWDINTESFQGGSHFATFPKKLIISPLDAGCPEKVCLKCDVPFREEACCNCDVGFRPGVVLDPFFGSGTVGIVAKDQGKDYIGIELNPNYIKLAENRIAREKLRDKKNNLLNVVITSMKKLFD